MNNSSGLYECEPASSTPNDDLYLERLDAFFQKTLADIKSFAERESRSYEETRRTIAQWHAKHLFQPSSSASNFASENNLDRIVRVRGILKDVSHILEALSDTAGVQSFVLAVNPSDPSDMGFLGGSLLGREFWRGLRSGGEQGARSFKTTCLNRLPRTTANLSVNQPVSQATSNSPSPAPTPSSSVSLKGVLPSKSLKTDLYESVRTSLRAVSGNRTAEMKWTNPERLDVFGVRLVGWPQGIPQQNPSSLKTTQNRQLLEALQKGSMKFERLFPDPAVASSSTLDKTKPQPGDKQDDDEDFSWAYNTEPLQSSHSTSLVHATQATHSVNADPVSGRNPTRVSLPPKPRSPEASEPDDSPWRMDNSQLDINSGLGTYNVDFGWDEFSDHLLSTIGSDWDNESPIVRPKKRPRTDMEMNDDNNDDNSRHGDEL